MSPLNSVALGLPGPNHGHTSAHGLHRPLQIWHMAPASNQPTNQAELTDQPTYQPTNTNTWAVSKSASKQSSKQEGTTSRTNHKAKRANPSRKNHKAKIINPSRKNHKAKKYKFAGPLAQQEAQETSQLQLRTPKRKQATAKTPERPASYS